MQKRRGKGLLWAGVVIGFFIALYLVESDTFGSAAVAVHNGGYGTFDMKSYDEKIVAQVLAQADAECREAYYRYYGMDFVFILFFGLLQYMLSGAVYRNTKAVLKWIAVGVPIARGIFDMVENLLLLITISRYPDINSGMIRAASVSTQCKLWCIRIWVVFILGGLSYNAFRKSRLSGAKRKQKVS